jgi:gas vesicle protein/plasmid stabilization system protein ParE
MALRMESARRLWPVVAGLVLGVILGVIVSLLGSGTRKAEASVLISSPAGTSAVRPMLANLRELATSGVVAGNVRSTLRLTEPAEKLRRHLDATVRPGTEVIALTATDETEDRARQLAQEAAVVLAQLVDARFGTGKPELHGAVLDSAHGLGGTDRDVTRNALAGGLIGLLLGSAAMFVLASSSSRVTAPAVDDRDLERRERLLEQRVKSVSSRERALAEQVGKIAAREQELEERAVKVAARERVVSEASDQVATTKEGLAERAKQVTALELELEARAAAPPPDTGGPATQPEVEPALPAPTAAWNLNELQKVVDSQTNVSPEQAEEWRTYLFLLRQHASQDGALARSFEPLIREVFAEILHLRAPS